MDFPYFMWFSYLSMINFHWLWSHLLVSNSGSVFHSSWLCISLKVKVGAFVRFWQLVYRCLKGKHTGTSIWKTMLHSLTLSVLFELQQPMRSKHCEDCKQCVRKHDHHCPWLDTCVGEGNHKYFWLFLLLTSILVIWTFAITWSVALWLFNVNLSAVICVDFMKLFINYYLAEKFTIFTLST